MSDTYSFQDQHHERYTDNMFEAIDAVQSGDLNAVLAFLNIMAVAPGLTTLSIFSVSRQKPDATWLRWGKDWKNDGYYIKKGEKGISAASSYDENGKATYSSLFDRSQIVGDPQRSPATPQKYNDAINALFKSAPCEVEIKEMSKYTDPFMCPDFPIKYDLMEKKIKALQGKPNISAERCCWEVAKAIGLAYTEKLNLKEDERKFFGNAKKMPLSYEERAFFGDCVAYVFCKYNGIAIKHPCLQRIPDFMKTKSQEVCVVFYDKIKETIEKLLSEYDHHMRAYMTKRERAGGER